MAILFDRRPSSSQRPTRTTLRARLALERLEKRDVFSSSIPLNGFTWSPIGPSPITQGQFPGRGFAAGPMTSIAVDRVTSNIMFAAGSTGGVWRSLDGGQTWSPRTDHAATLNTQVIITIHRTPGNTVYAQTDLGMLKSTDNGETFTLLPNSPRGGFIAANSFSSRMRVFPNAAFQNDPTRDTIFVIGDGQGALTGLWRSTNGGASWTQIFGAAADFLTDVVVDSTNLNVVYAAIGTAGPGLNLNNGVYKSLNALSPNPTFNLQIGGQALLPGAIAGTIRLAIAPALPSVLFMSVAERIDAVGGASNLLGVFRSFDGGRNWLRLTNTPNFMRLEGELNNVIAIDPSSPAVPSQQIVYLAGSGDTANNVLISYNSGENWRNFDLSDDNDISVGVDGIGPYINSHGFAFDSTNRLHLATNGGIFRLNNRNIGTHRWQALNGSPGPNALNTNTIVASAVPVDNPNRVLSNLGKDHNAAFFEDFAGAGTLGYGWRATDLVEPIPGYHTSPDSISPDGTGNVLWDPNRDNVMFRVLTGQTGRQDFVRRTIDGGMTWQGVSSGIAGPPQPAAYVPLLEFDPGNTFHIFAATNQISVSNDGGENFGTTLQVSPNVSHPIPALPPDASMNSPPVPFLTAMGIGRQAGGQYLLAATPSYTVDYTDNGPMIVSNHPHLYFLFIPEFPLQEELESRDWWRRFGRDLNFPGTSSAVGPGETITSIVIDPANTGNVYLITDFGAKLYVMSSVNSLFDTTVEITGNMPGSVNAMALDSRVITDPTDDILYVGTSPDGVNPGGVYSLTAPGFGPSNWQAVGLDPNNGNQPTLPNQIVTDIDINPTTGIMTASTFGRGVWQIQIRGFIQGRAYEDLNGNGLFDVGEPTLSNVTIRLLDAAAGDAELASTVTDANGFYEFRSLTSGLLPGDYKVVQITPSGFIQSSANPPTLELFGEQSSAVGTFTGIGSPPPSYQIIPTLNFGNFRLASLSGKVFEDLNGNQVLNNGEPGLAGVTMFLDTNNNGKLDGGEITTITGPDGVYTFTDLPPGQYLIRQVVPTGFAQISAPPGPISPVSGQITGGINFADVRVGVNRIQGTVYFDANGNGSRDANENVVAGFSVLLDTNNDGIPDRQAATNAQGIYTFDGLGAGTYLVRMQPRRGFRTTQPVSGQYIVTGTVTPNGVEFPNNLDFGVRNDGFYAVGRDAGNLPSVSVRTLSNNQETANFLAYGAAFRGGVRVATGFVTTPGVTQIVTATGPGGGPHVRVWTVVGPSVAEAWGFFAYAPNFTGGMFVAVGDVNGDGFDDIVTAPDVGGGPNVRVFSGQTRSLIASFNAYDPGFTGGVRVAVADVDADGRPDIITGAGPGGGPHVRVFSGVNYQIIREFFAYGATFRGGVFVAAGDFNQDGRADIVTGAGAGGGPDTRIYSGLTGGIIGGLFPYAATFRGGVRVFSADINGDGRLDVVVGSGPGAPPNVSAYNLNANNTFTRITTYNAFDPTFLGGVFVG